MTFSVGSIKLSGTTATVPKVNQVRQDKEEDKEEQMEDA